MNNEGWKSLEEQFENNLDKLVKQFYPQLDVEINFVNKHDVKGNEYDINICIYTHMWGNYSNDTIESCIATILKKARLFGKVENIELLSTRVDYEMYFDLHSSTIKKVRIKKVNNFKDILENKCDILYLPSDFLTNQIKEFSDIMEEDSCIEFYNVYGLIERRTEVLTDKTVQNEYICTFLHDRKRKLDEAETIIRSM